MASLADNLARVRERIARATERAGRDAGSVILVAVTKGHGIEAVRALWELGEREFGENRVQEAVPKMMSALDGVHWHLIGHLQENKINKILPQVHWIQSIDSLELARAVEVRAARLGRSVPVLLEVKTTSEPTKHGLAPEAVIDVAGFVAAMPHLELRGLMTIAALDAGELQARRSFATVRGLGERLELGFQPVLSMGMSDDFEIAIDEGSTMVRVGRALLAG
jgi:pyridoxal phosphate enzyme (YggS family)